MTTSDPLPSSLPSCWLFGSPLVWHSLVPHCYICSCPGTPRASRCASPLKEPPASPYWPSRYSFCWALWPMRQASPTGFSISRLHHSAESAVAGYVNVASSVGFAWMSGSALADSAALGKIMVPAMERNGYKRDFAVGLTSSAALISPVMPPSIPAVIFASVATISTGALFAASVLPAFLLAVALCLTVFIYVRRHSELKATPRSRAEIKQATVRGIGPLPARSLFSAGF